MAHPRTKTLAVVTMTLLSAGCATAPDQVAEPHEEKVYRTGSNIPLRDPGTPSEVRSGTSINLPPAGMPNRGPGG